MRAQKKTFSSAILLRLTRVFFVEKNCATRAKVLREKSLSSRKTFFQIRKRSENIIVKPFGCSCFYVDQVCCLTWNQLHKFELKHFFGNHLIVCETKICHFARLAQKKTRVRRKRFALENFFLALSPKMFLAFDDIVLRDKLDFFLREVSFFIISSAIFFALAALIFCAHVFKVLRLSLLDCFFLATSVNILRSNKRDKCISPLRSNCKRNVKFSMYIVADRVGYID